jgi:hypothetical protein
MNQVRTIMCKVQQKNSKSNHIISENTYKFEIISLLVGICQKTMNQEVSEGKIKEKYNYRTKVQKC